MKYIIITIALLFIGCTKQTTCKCTTSYSGSGVYTEDVIQIYNIDCGKCENQNNTIVVSGVTAITKCRKIKALK